MGSVDQLHNTAGTSKDINLDQLP